MSSPLMRIESLRATGFQGLAQLEMTFPAAADPEQGQWIVLLGDNGTGKSSILRALALTLSSGIELASEIFTRRGAFTRQGRDDASIAVASGGVTWTATFTSSGGFSQGTSTNGKPPVHPFFVGYGALRGTALGGGKRAVDLDDRGVFGVRSLFLEDSPVIHAETWLRDLAFAGTRDPQAAKRHDAVLDVLCKVLPDVSRIEVEPDQTWVTGTNFGRLPLATLSDGYLTSAGWLIDMLARWVRYAQVNKLVIGAGFHHEMEGFALVDEIDLHLHPRWQTEILSNLRSTFPRMSFVVTTHNPLTIQGAMPGEVWVLRRQPDESGAQVVVAEQSDVPLGMRADQILTGKWFGLPSTLDGETQALLDKHRDLLRNDVPEHDRERAGVEDELRTRLGRFNETSAEGIARTLVAEVGVVAPEEMPALKERFRQAFGEHVNGRPRTKPTQLKKPAPKKAQRKATKKLPAKRGSAKK